MQRGVKVNRLLRATGALAFVLPFSTLLALFDEQVGGWIVLAIVVIAVGLALRAHIELSKLLAELTTEQRRDHEQPRSSPTPNS